MRATSVFVLLLLAATAEAGTIVGSEAGVYGVNQDFGAPLDLVVTVVDDGGTTEYEIVETFVNTTGLEWIGFQHRLGLGEGEAFELVSNSAGMDFDGPVYSAAFDLDFIGVKKLDWWNGDAPDGSTVGFTLWMSVPDSTSIPAEFRNADGYTFTLRHYPSTPPPPAPAGWWRGNTHTHSHLSYDSMDPPDVVAAFYEQLGYDFLVLTDHSWDKGTGSLGWSDFSAYSTPDLLCISGEELTHPTNHTNGLGTSSGIIAGTIAENVAAILAQGAIPSLSHPGPSISLWDILDVDELAHMEIYNGFIDHGTEYTDKWDVLLGLGKPIWGMAVDDTHILTRHAGKGWIMVRSETLDETGILGAIEVGDFYASNGVTLTELAIDSRGICVESANGEHVRFIGSSGVPLATSVGSGGAYQFTGQEPYVRAEVSNSYQQTAWTQPVFATCPWDCADGDGVTGIVDLLALLSQWNGPGACDFDFSGTVDVLDLLTLIGHYDPAGTGCP